ncbi:MAG: AAA family ATPase [Pseudomonadota bacterium]
MICTDWLLDADMTDLTPSSLPNSDLRACLVVRDPSAFALLIEDLSDALGDAWGELNPVEATAFLAQDDAKRLDFVIVGVDEDDRAALPTFQAVLERAKSIGIPALLVAEDLTASELHQLIQSGAQDFLPYPLPQGALTQAMGGLTQPATVAPEPTPAGPAPLQTARSGAMFAVQGLSGGTGATTLAVTLADELAEMNAGRVCLIDLDLQFGSCGNALNLRAQDSILDMLTNIEMVDRDGLGQTLQTRPNGLHVLTAPAEIVPLDLLPDRGLSRLLDVARSAFDFVVVDMPKTMVNWTEVALTQADIVFCPIELDIRSAHAASRFKATLSAEGIALNQMRFVLNRAPKFADLAGKSRVKRLGEVLQSSIDILLPDGGRLVSQAADQGMPLSQVAPKSIYRRDIQYLAQNIARHGQNSDVAA